MLVTGRWAQWAALFGLTMWKTHFAKACTITGNTFVPSEPRDAPLTAAKEVLLVESRKRFQQIFGKVNMNDVLQKKLKLHKILGWVEMEEVYSNKVGGFFLGGGSCGR